MKNVLLIILSGAALAGAMYFAWQKGRESSGNGNAASLERRLESVDKRMTALDQRLAERSKPGNIPGGVSALRLASGPLINPPVLTEEQLKVAPPVNAELTAAVQKAIEANPVVREALNYYVFSIGWMNANQQTVDSLKSWCKTGGEFERVFREEIQRKVSMAINAAVWSTVDKDPSTAEMVGELRKEFTRAGRAPYDPERTGKFEDVEKYVDYSTSPPTIDMYSLGQDMGANMKLTIVESQIEIPQDAIDHTWNHGRAVLLYGASQMFLKKHAPEILDAADKHAEKIPVLLARLAKP